MTQRRLQPSLSGSKQRSPVSAVIKLSLPFASGCYPFLTHERTDGPVTAGEQVRGGGVVVVCVSPNQAPGKKDPLGCTSSISSPLPCRVLAARLSQYLHQRGLCWCDGSSELAASPHTAHPPPTLRVRACVWVIKMLGDRVRLFSRAWRASNMASVTMENTFGLMHDYGPFTRFELPLSCDPLSNVQHVQELCVRVCETRRRTPTAVLLQVEIMFKTLEVVCLSLAEQHNRQRGLQSSRWASEPVSQCRAWSF